ncbi:MAG: thiamine pyrophosphate-dependent enzyme, partial [Nocardioides sp.]
DRIRGGGGPCFLELRTYRFRAHSMYDPERYRQKAEVESWKQRDPIELLVDRLTALGVLGDEIREQMTVVVRAEVDRACAEAEEAALEPIEELTRFVHSEPTQEES